MKIKEERLVLLKALFLRLIIIDDKVREKKNTMPGFRKISSFFSSVFYCFRHESFGKYLNAPYLSMGLWRYWIFLLSTFSLRPKNLKIGWNFPWLTNKFWTKTKLNVLINHKHVLYSLRIAFAQKYGIWKKNNSKLILVSLWHLLGQADKVSFKIKQSQITLITSQTNLLQ